MTEKAFVQYIQDWIDGKSISSKTPGLTMSIEQGSSKEFAKKLLAQAYFKNFVVHYYGDETWNKVEEILKNKQT
jgi:uncharacterized protein YutE (UPF0331/DUF86 family)